METKMPFYGIVNNFLPGLVLIGAYALMFFDDVRFLVEAITDLGSTGLEILVTVSLFALAYEIGYIIFRLGAALIEPILMKSFGWAEYADFIAASKTSEKAGSRLKMLSREYGYARTRIMLFVILALLTIIANDWWLLGICLFCVLLFSISARSYMKKTQTAVKQYLSGNGGQQ